MKISKILLPVILCSVGFTANANWECMATSPNFAGTGHGNNLLKPMAKMEALNQCAKIPPTKEQKNSCVIKSCAKI